jgi:hypothetical protein
LVGSLLSLIAVLALNSCPKSSLPNSYVSLVATVRLVGNGHANQTHREHLQDDVLAKVFISLDSAEVMHLLADPWTTAELERCVLFLLREIDFRTDLRTYFRTDFRAYFRTDFRNGSWGKRIHVLLNAVEY